MPTLAPMPIVNRPIDRPPKPKPPVTHAFWVIVDTRARVLRVIYGTREAMADRFPGLAIEGPFATRKAAHARVQFFRAFP